RAQTGASSPNLRKSAAPLFQSPKSAGKVYRLQKFCGTFRFGERGKMASLVTIRATNAVGCPIPSSGCPRAPDASPPDAGPEFHCRAYRRTFFANPEFERSLHRRPETLQWRLGLLESDIIANWFNPYWSRIGLRFDSSVFSGDDSPP